MLVRMSPLGDVAGLLIRLRLLGPRRGEAVVCSEKICPINEVRQPPREIERSSTQGFSSEGEVWLEFCICQ